MDAAARALADLTEISSQIEAAVLLDGEGRLVAATQEGQQAEAVAEAARRLLDAAQAARTGTSEPLAQLEAATLGGSVFVARDGERTIAATTGAEPTVGLVFYDLKSALRTAAAGEARDGGS
jgi:predicted regulator of Ras-like GTPase activity (Roadblock/LC7/MglB family)